MAPIVARRVTSGHGDDRAPARIERIMTELPRFALAAGAALVGGACNAIAGGGSLITFPALIAGGMSPVVASLTNTVALCPGYVGAVLAQRRDMIGQRSRLMLLVPTSAIGGVLGAILLLHTADQAFSAIVPYLILIAAALLAGQNWLRSWLVARATAGHSEAWAIAPMGLTAIYGGYFGAGMGVMMLAAFSVVLNDSLTRLNALKQAASLAINVAAACIFVVSGHVDWPIAGVMFVGSLAGGALGGLVASRIPPGVLRWTVVVLAVAVGIIYLVK
jgi:uncharacterized membrane protein YfcA